MIKIKINIFFESTRSKAIYGLEMLCILCRGHVLNEYQLFVNRR